jgi:hypothetical protein
VRRDGPRALTRLALAALPVRRAEWGRAMSSELEHIDGRGARWRFALGCAWVAARLGAARYVAGAGAGVAALVAYGLVRWPGILVDDGLGVAVAHLSVLALLLSVYATAGLALAGAAGRRRTTRVGVAGGLVAAALWAASLAANVLVDPGRLSALATTLGIAAGAALVLAGARCGSGVAGLRAGVCAGLVIGLAGFVVLLALAYLATGHLTADPALADEFRASAARDLPTYAVGETMAAAFTQLWLAPAVGAALGALGGVAAQIRR